MGIEEVKDSSLLYLDRLGVWVGEFTQEQIQKGLDQSYIAYMKLKTGLEYVNTRKARGDNGEKLLRIWVCNEKDCTKEV